MKYLPEKLGVRGQAFGAARADASWHTVDAGAKPKVTKKCTKWPQNVTVFASWNEL